jgi:hypothetical protein
MSEQPHRLKGFRSAAIPGQSFTVLPCQPSKELAAVLNLTGSQRLRMC